MKVYNLVFFFTLTALSFSSPINAACTKPEGGFSNCSGLDMTCRNGNCVFQASCSVKSDCDKNNDCFDGKCKSYQ